MSAAKFDMSEVLVKHGGGLPSPTTAEPVCFCGWRGVSITHTNTTWLEQHAEHQADAISAHIAEMLGSSAVFDAVTLAISDIRDDYPRLPTDADSGACADAALAAVGDLLGVEVGR